MSVRTTSLVWDTENLQPSSKLVLLCLADHADPDGGTIFPSVARVARMTGLSERQVQRQMRLLQEAGHLVQVKVATRYRPTEYRIPRGDTDVTPDDARGDTHVTPADEPRGDIEGGSGAPRGDTGVVSGVTPMSPEPSLEPSVTTRTTTLAPTSGARKRDLAFEALCLIEGAPLEELTSPGRGAINRALKEIRLAWKGDPEDLPVEIIKRAEHLVATFPNAQPTAPSLAKHWARLATQPRDFSGLGKQAQRSDRIQALMAEAKERRAI